MVFDKTKFLSQFRTEVLERLETASCNLVELEKYPENMDIYEAVKREFHTLKGITSLMGFDRTSELFHKLEDLFRKSDDIKKNFDSNTYDFLFQCIDTIQIVFRKEVINEDTIVAFTENVASKFLISVVEDSSGDIKNYTKSKKTDAVKTDLVKLNSKPVKPVFQEKNDKVKVEASQLTDLINYSNELLMIKSMMKNTLVNLESNVSDNKIINSEKFYSDFNRLNGIYEKLDRYSAAISRLSVNMRMISLDNLFNLYVRPVREMAKNYGVEVNLKFEGEKTLLDKDVLKYIIDPVLHIIRNAIDHGIETTQERQTKGKNGFGSIKFKAYQRSSKVYLEISDDGRGIDFRKLKNKVFQKGLAGLKEVNTFSEDKLLNFLFYHGFSTKDSVGMLSGRGVGLDVVKEKIEAINGSVKISSNYEKGTTVTLVLPLTLSITESLLVEAGTEVFAIPTDYIKEVRRLDTVCLHTNKKNLLEYVIADINIPAVDLCKYLNIQKRYLLENKRLSQVVIIDSENFQFCIIVDKVLTYIDTVIRPVFPVKGQLKAFLGGTVTGEGRAVLVLDVPTLTASAKSVNTKINECHTENLNHDEKFIGLKVLIAEDSANIAEIEKSILESFGFDVSLAADGKRAYEMAMNTKYDVILSDILMPGMNGIEFVKLLRKESCYSKIPIIMVTSRNNTADKLEAFTAGASEYILKSELTTDSFKILLRKYFKILRKKQVR